MAVNPHNKKRWLRWMLAVVGILIALRIALPYVILHFANKKLANLQGYYGHIYDIRVALYRGAYVIRNVNVLKVDTVKKDTVPFFSCPDIDLSVEWRAILHGKIVGEIEFEKPDLRYTLNKTMGKKRQKDTIDFIQLTKDMMPLRINRLAIDSGKIHYVDPESNPPVDLSLTNLTVEATGLTNHPNPNVLLPAYITASGNLYDGNLNLQVHLDPLNKVPTFDLNGELTKTNLVQMNQFFKVYGNFSLERGSLSLFTEFASRDNHFKGYVKPLAKDVRVRQGEGSITEVIWEALVGTTVQILKNQRKDQFATRLPIEGEYSQPDVGIVEAILAVLRNAFVQALRPAIEGSVNIKNVEEPEIKKGFLRKLFAKDKNQTENNAENKKTSN